MAKISPTCIKCGDPDAVVAVLLTGDEYPETAFRCGACDAEYTCTDVRATIAGWEKVLTWVQAMPDM